MMGLLDMLNSRDGVFGLALLDAASPKPTRTSIGAGLLQAMQGAQAWQAQQEDREQRRQQIAQQQRMAELQAQHLQAQMAQAAQQSQRQRAIESLPEQFMRPGVRPQTMDDRDVGQPGERSIPAQQFDAPGYATALMRFDPMAGLQLQQALAKPTAQPIKLGAGETLLDPATFRALATGPAKPADDPSDWRLYQLSGAAQRGLSFDQWDQARRRAGAASTTVSLGSPVPVTLPDGTQALVQPANRPGEPPQIMRMPTSGEPLRPPPKETPAALREKLATNEVTLGKIDKALSLVGAKPGSLGAMNYLPDAVTQRIDPQGVEVRAIVADIGGQKIHDRSGAAVSVGESARLRPYIPAATDTPETVRTKLQQFRSEYAAMQRALASGASIAQADAAGPAAQAPGGRVIDFGSLK